MFNCILWLEKILIFIGHYIALVKSHSHWLLFDDDVVTPIDESEVTSYFGMSRENDAANTDHGYILMYQQQ